MPPDTPSPAIDPAAPMTPARAAPSNTPSTTPPAAPGPAPTPTATPAAASGTPDAAPPTGAPVGRAENLRRLRAAVLFGVLAIGGALLVLYAWRLPPFTSPIQSTENAMVRGQTTLIGPQLSGYVVAVPVQDYQRVRQGDLLVKIDDRIYRQRQAQAEAQLASQHAALANATQQRASAQATLLQGQAGLTNAQAQAARAAADLRRVEELVSDGSLSLRERDQARAAAAQAVAAVAQARATIEIGRQNLRSVTVNRGVLEAAVQNAEAALQLARIDVANTEIRAPRDGQLGQVTVRLGAYVSAGTQLTALVPDQLWVIANYKETQMAHVQPGQPASFQVDALERASLKATVERISPATGSEFSVIPPDNATGNFVKIAQRIPVRLRIEPGQPLAERLRPGMSVVVSIDTRVQPAAAAASRPQP